MTKTKEAKKLPANIRSIQETSKLRESPQVTLHGAAGVAIVLEAFSLMPSLAVAEGMGKSMRALFKEVTGQDVTRLAKVKVREKTLQAMEERQQRWLEGQFKDFPEGLARLSEHMATAPKTCSGAQAAWATWIHQQEQPPALHLPISKAVGLAIDELVESLRNHCRTDDLTAYRQAWLDHFRHHGLLIRAGGEAVLKPMAPDAPDWDKLQSMTNWEIANQLTRELLEGLYFDLVSALDVEWSAWYFAVMQPMPLFPLVMVKVHDGLKNGEEPKPRKNLIRQPQRRLLEFMYAVMEYKFRDRWHKKEPLPKVVGKALDLLPAEVSNYFDGTRRLTYKKVDNYWRQLIKHFSGKTAAPAEMPAPPMPMVALALHWQTLLVLDKGKEKSFILVDLDSYNERWKLRRQRWESQNKGMTERPAGHPTKELGEWPAWMLNQSSSVS